ncbi:MAG: hypothetical protein JWM78_1743 [Verrucomicrobiaceae bacterium]|nr:hypothetical protein [Verrucomicrobiaceae bacterium]
MKMKLLSLLIASACAGTMPSAFAADDAAILKRLDHLEAQRKADQAEITALRNKVQQLETQKPQAAAGVSSDEAAKLHEEIVNVEKKSASRVDSVKRTLDAERDKLKINGYMSVYGVKATDRALTLGSGVDNQINFKSDTVAAVQFDYQLTDRVNAVVQLQSAGKNNYDLKAPWAFLGYKLTDSTKIRAGRMVVPNYLYADSIDVGYTYPWVRPPIEMYGVDAIEYQGVDVLQSFNFGGWNNTLQVFFGDLGGDNSGYSLHSSYGTGAGVTLNNDAWTLRASATHAEGLTLDPTLAAFKGNINYFSAAVRYDNGALFALVEGKQVRVSGDLDKLTPDTDGFYTTLGYQIGEFMPYATWAKAYSVNDADMIGVNPKQHVQSTGIGLRYNLNEKVVLKGEATKYDHFNGTLGASGLAAVPFGRLATDTAQGLDKDGATVMSLGFDAIF